MAIKVLNGPQPGGYVGTTVARAVQSTRNANPRQVQRLILSLIPGFYRGEVGEGMRTIQWYHPYSVDDSVSKST